MKTFFTILLVIASFVIIIAVMSQDSKSNGLASLSTETNLGGSGGRVTKDQIINRVVIISAVVFLISAMAISYLS